MKKFNKNDFRKRLSKSKMDNKTFDKWMDNPKNFNDKGENNTRERGHGKYFDKIRNLFNQVHNGAKLLQAEEVRRIDNEFLRDITHDSYFSRLSKAPMSNEIFKSIEKSNNKNAVFDSSKANNDLFFLNKIRNDINEIHALYEINHQLWENGEYMDDKLEKAISVLKYKKQIILQGSPGTGKTRLAKEIAKKLAPDNYKLIQFHPAYGYEDFVRGIVATTANGDVNYEVQNKILAEMAENAINNPDEKFVLIVDEINRANLSSVLGELIYALEYRGESVESMYEYQESREIILPENLYIIGTMNTADRSVGHIDYAIRRRFAFVDVDTDEGVIPDDAKPLFNKVKDLFKQYLNKEEFELNDVMIGHSYFLKENLELALEYEIKPILQEYRKDGVLVDREDKIKDKIEALKIED